MKVIHQELCKKLKFYNITKWYELKTETVPGNETHKIIWDFEIQADHIIPARRSDLVWINKKKRQRKLAVLWIFRPNCPLSKNQRKWKENKHQDVAREVRKMWNMKVTVVTIVISAFETAHKILGPKRIGNRRMNQTITTTAMLRSVRKLRRVLDTRGDLLLLRLQWKTNS